MAKITAALVSELRSKTGVGMMDCKKALSETDGDVQAAQDWLRKNGLAAAAKKAGRAAAKGLVGVSVSGNAAAIVEVNSETDFVARNEKFQTFVKAVADLTLGHEADLVTLEATGYPGSDHTVKDELTQLVATIGENIEMRRCETLSVDKGVVASYVHNAATPGFGEIAVLVALKSEGDTTALETLGKQIAMHIAARSPQALKIEDLDADVKARERDILMSQAESSGKPPEIIEKMIEGRMRKFYEDVVLLEQISVIDNETKISKVVEQAARDAGKPVELVGFIRYGLGEGKAQREDNFAEEVAAAAGN